MSEQASQGAKAAAITKILEASGLSPAERLEIPGHPAVRVPPPAGLHAKVRKRLEKIHPEGIYAHQARAIEDLLAGKDVCLATPTASGKSLAFMAVAAHLALTNPEARTLALYPLKALIRDQLGKWKTFLELLGLSVGFIDGSVDTKRRAAILASSQVVAMTPDVMHAWFMSRAATPEAAPFARALRLLVLDEAHVYEGVFGTNMAYLLRRLGVVAGPFQIMASTATVGEPAETMEQLTGRSMEVLGADADGSPGQQRTLLLAKAGEGGSFDSVVKLLATLAREGQGHFLAFADSRKAVEQITAAIHRHDKAESEDDAPPEGHPDAPPAEAVLPYRAGYEDKDRDAIQAALAAGQLAGVVSTSALELGLDIGDIDVVVLVNTPPTVKAFRQRIGRAGRRRPSVCVIVDELDAIRSLEEYMGRPAEAGWIYMQNRYIQYSQAICASTELQAKGIVQATPGMFPGLPAEFLRFVQNELQPAHAVEDDLFPLKQAGAGSPHHAFPVRNAAEQGFKILMSQANSLGSLSHGQLLREAYPGGVYYHMARPYRVMRVDFRGREVHVRPEKFVSTKPVQLAMVFPQFGAGILQARRSADGFVAEVELQVTEYVKGFVEQRGRNKTPHEYGPGSIHSQRPLSRYLQTTGVCLAFPAKVARSEALARKVMDAFCRTCGVLERDVGFALFSASNGPFDPAPTAGIVVYDATSGSLRLTQRLVDRLEEVLAAAIEMDEGEPSAELEALLEAAAATEQVTVTGGQQPASPDDGWVEVVAPGETAILVDGPSGAQEVKVVGYRYTPHGLVYQLERPGTDKWFVAAQRVRALAGVTRVVLVDLATGEEKDAA